MRCEKIWVLQCKATKSIRRRFGVKSALDYLIREKLVRFAQGAESSPEFAKEFPRFLAAVWQTFINTSWPVMWMHRDHRYGRNCDVCSICSESTPIIPGPEGLRGRAEA
jgi:hypothetical protein